MSTPTDPTSTPPATTAPIPTPVTLTSDQLTALAQAIAQQLAPLLMTVDPAPMTVGDPLSTSGLQTSPPPATVITVAPQFPQPPASTVPSTTTPAPGATS